MASKSHFTHPCTGRIRRRLLALAVTQALAWHANAAFINVDSKLDTVAQDGECTLREALDNANSQTSGAVHADCDPGAPGRPDTVQIASFIEEIQLTAGQLEIHDSVFIGGEESAIPTLFASPANRIFNIDSGDGSDISVTLSALRLTGGDASQGGAVRGSFGTSLVLLHSEILGNSATANGGGILNRGSTNLLLTTISDNSAGGSSGGGGLTSYGNLEILSSRIEDNSAGDNGGGISAYGDSLLIRDSRITGNLLAGGNGGGLNARNATIINSVITDNTATSGSGGGLAIAGNIELRDSIVGGNSAAEYGGGLHVSLSTGVPEAMLVDSIIRDNISGLNGGGVAVFGRLEMDGCEVTSNGAGSFLQGADGGGLFVDGVADINSTLIDQNAAERDGGGIATGAEAELILRNTTVSDNVAFNSAGGILLDGLLDAQSGRIARNQAQGSGGGLLLRSSLGAQLADVIVENNTCGGRGGGLHLESGNLLFAYSTARGNTAIAGIGGGMYVGGTAQSFYGYINQNQANRGAGVFVAQDAAFTAQFSGLSGNSATTNGGAIFVDGDGRINLQKSSISSNSARTGGGVYLYSEESSGLFSQSTFTANTAIDRGGAIASFYEVTLRNSTISGNTALVGGGVLAGGSLILNQSTIVQNESEVDGGGGVYLDLGINSLSIVNSIIAENTGGDCANQYQQFVQTRNTLVGDGSCQQDAIDPIEGNPQLSDLTFGENTLVHIPLSGSIVVDAGAGEQFCSQAEDQAGTLRPLDGDADGDPRCDIGAIEFIDIYPPLFQLTPPEINEGQDAASLRVFYQDVDGAVDLESIDSADLLVIGPDGFESGVELEFVEITPQGSGVAGNYRISAPGGTWDGDDVGEYSVEIQPGEVADLAATGPNTISQLPGSMTFSVAFAEIDVRGNGNSILDEDVTPETGDHTDFGEVALGTSIVRVFEVHNVGTQVLEITSASTNNSEFAVVADPVGNLLPSESDQLSIRYTPAAAAESTATVSIGSNDFDEAVFNYTLKATGVPAPLVEIAISGNGVDIESGDLEPSSSDGTDFGVARPGALVTQSFVVTSQGTADLSLNGPIDISGTAFSVTRQPQETTLTPGSAVEFDVTFAPQLEGEFSATLALGNNDPDENPYIFTIRGVAENNNPPVVTSARFVVAVDAGLGAFVGQVSVTDVDSGIPPTGAFAISAGNTGGTFAIDDSGVIRVANTAGLIGDFKLTVSVADNEGLQGAGRIDVMVTQPDFVFANGFEAASIEDRQIAK